MSSNLIPTPAVAPLSPNTLAAAEAALRYNKSIQTSSAGRPQPTTPLGPSRPSSNYAAAALQRGANPSAPHPPSFQAAESTDSAASVELEDAPLVLEPGKLSRGTTQLVLEKMASPEFESALRKRMSREGERKTRLVPVKSGESGSADGETGGAGAAKPGFDRQQSWSQEDMKRIMSERLMAPVEDGEGYSSEAGT